MTPGFTRRDVVRMGGLGAALALAGCSTGGDDDSDGESSESNSGSGPEPDSASGSGASGSQSDQVAIGAVSEVLLRTPLEIQVQHATEVDTVDTFGIEMQVEEGMVGYAVTLAFKNASDAYVSFATDGFAMLADAEQVVDNQKFGELTSTSFGGVALAPGELRTYDISFEVPDGASRYGVAGRFEVKTLPGTEFFPVDPILVDFAQDAGLPPITQTLDIPFRGLDETVGVGGLDVTVREIFFADEAGRGRLREGEEFGLGDVRIDNGTRLPVAAGIGFGGFGFQDDVGTRYTSNRGAEGSVGEREIIDLPNGIQPGEAVEGIIAAGIPQGTEPLYLTFTPPPALYANADDVPEHKFFWQAR
ncbi:hypothetical protein [Haloarcula ordinaria]|nr:hypothetical protein [Halomicroarcula sp. ZS-22-S1]